MATCTTNSVAPCGLQYNSARVQLEQLLLLLGAVNTSTNWTTNLAAAQDAGLTCLSVGQLKAKFAQQVCEGLVDVNCQEFQCYQDQDLWAMAVLLGCEIVDGL